MSEDKGKTERKEEKNKVKSGMKMKEEGNKMEKERTE
jgi:hypothetical protein